MSTMKLGMISSLALLSLGLGSCAMMQQEPGMTFFITSAGSGKGADFGGLAGADRHCQSLAAAAGAGGRTWRAYLSTTAADGQPAVNARDRIGTGPWYNAKKVMVARDLAELHGKNNLNKQSALIALARLARNAQAVPRRQA